MNWIKRIMYNDGGRVRAGFPSSSGDCVVRALSILTGAEYESVRTTLQIYIARERGSRSDVENGVYPKTYKKFLKTVDVLGWRNVTKWEQVPTEGKLMVVLGAHVVAVIDGVIHDTFDPVDAEHCGKIFGYYRLN